MAYSRCPKCSSANFAEVPSTYGDRLVDSLKKGGLLSIPLAPLFAVPKLGFKIYECKSCGYKWNN